MKTRINRDRHRYLTKDCSLKAMTGIGIDHESNRIDRRNKPMNIKKQSLQKS